MDQPFPFLTLNYTSPALLFAWTQDSRPYAWPYVQPLSIWVLCLTSFPLILLQLLLLPSNLTPFSHLLHLISDLCTSLSPNRFPYKHPDPCSVWMLPLPFYPISSSPLIHAPSLSPQILLPIWSLIIPPPLLPRPHPNAYAIQVLTCNHFRSLTCTVSPRPPSYMLDHFDDPHLAWIRLTDRLSFQHLLYFT
jgi:hypothetical protein